jgi:flagellin
MTSVNTNISALVAAQNLEKTSKELDSAIARLSSGLRINSAKDDAAGMAIASKMESQVKGLSMAIRNGTDSQNLIDTSEGAQVETVNILQRLRELAVQSANDSNTALDRTFINAEATQLLAEVDRIATQTTWNGTNLLDGTFLSKQFQLGSNNGEDVTFSIDSAKSADIGNYRVNGTSTLIDANDDAITAQTLTLSGHIGSTTAAISAGGNAKDVATGVNAVTNLTGITASAVTKVKLHSMTTAGDITFTLGNDASSSPGSAAITASVTDVTDIRSIMTAINAVSGTTGIKAEVHSDGNSALVLTHSEGEDIKITSFTHSGANLTAHMHVDVLDQDGAAVTEGAGFANSQILNDVTTDDNSLVVAESVAVNTAFTLVSGIKAEFNAKLTITNSAHTQAGSAVIVGTGADGSALTETLSYSTSASGSVTSVNTFATITSVTNDATALTGSSTIIVGQLANTGVDAVGQVRFDSSQAFTVTTDEVDNGEGFLGTTATNTASLSQLSSITLGTVAGSEAAIDVIDGAIAKINAQRSDLGAISNRLDATLSNLSNIVTNTQSSLSNIKDADFSQETSRLTKAQILSQAATSMLAQANASKQTVLQLLQG